MTGDRLRPYAPVEAGIECSGETHRLRWEAGELTALDHRDVEGERALAALGGTRCACVDALDGWARHADDLRVLILARRGPGDEIPSPGPMGPRPPRGTIRSTVTSVHGVGSRPLQGGWFGYAPMTAMASAYSDGESDALVDLLGIDGRLSQRLAATVAATWAQRLAAGDPRVESLRVRPALAAAVYGRATVTLRRWLAEPGVELAVDMLDAPQDPPTIGRTREGVHLAVPFDWIVDVWGRGLDVILDRLVLSVLDEAPDRLTLLTIGRSLADPRPLTLTLG
jgi:hypothetical protein